MVCDEKSVIIGLVTDEGQSIRKKSAVWNSLSLKDIKRIEVLQHRTTKMIIELRGMDYNVRLKNWGQNWG